MKKINFLKSGYFWAAAILCGSSATMTSCVNDELDFENELELEASLGGSITLPLGTLDAIRLGDMLDVNDIKLLNVMENGDYKVSMEDNITFDLGSLNDHDDVVLNGINGTEMMTSTLDIPSVGSGNIAIDGCQIELDDITTTINESIVIPNELSEIHSMTFASDVFLTLDIKVEIDGADDCELKLDDYTIALPKFLKFADGTLSKDNVLTINAPFELVKGADGKSYRQFSRKYQIEAIDLSDKAYSDANTMVGGKRKFTVDEDILLSGALSLGEGNIDLGEVSRTIKSTVNYNVSDMTISKVYGLFTPELKRGTEEFDLSDFAEALDGDRFSMALADPSINFTVTNTLDIPLQIDYLKLIPTKDGNLIANSLVDGGTEYTIAELKEPIVIEAANNGEPVVTKVCITSTEKEDQDGVKYAKIYNLNYILDGLPDHIAMEYGASAITTQTHMIDLSRSANNPYYFNLDYNLDMPLAFEHLSIDYTTEVSDLGESLGDALDYIDGLELSLDIENTIPIELSIESITPLDENDTPLTALDPLIESGSAVIEANGTSHIELKIADNDAGDLSRVETLKLELSALVHYVKGGEKLNANQSITIKASASLPKGIVIDFDLM